jgi:hypothetical protein
VGKAATVMPPVMAISKGAEKLGIEATRDLLVQIRPIMLRFDDEALASAYTRRDKAISDIGLSHDAVAKQISELRGFLKANFQLDVIDSEFVAVLPGGDVVCTHYTENRDSAFDQFVMRILFLR